MARKASRRELTAPRGDKRYVRRDTKGRIKESDDQGRSLARDPRRKAKTAAKAGQGDRGDRPTAKRKVAKRKASQRMSGSRAVRT
jgi:hypothetical protein